MPITYRIDSSKGLLICVASGVITEDDLEEYKEQLRADPDLPAVAREITDFRDASFTIPIQKIPQVASLHSDVFADGRTTRCAVLVSSDLVFGLVRMYAQCVSRMGHEVLPFRSMAEAEEWLGLD